VANKPRTRANSAEHEKRVTDVESWLLDGLTRTQVLKKAKGWGVTDRQVDDYIAEAKGVIKEINLADRDENMSLVTKNLWDLYRFQRINDPGEARKILMDIAELRGLKETTIQHFVNERPLQQIEDDLLEGSLTADDDERH
jgi:hypothetical protein